MEELFSLKDQKSFVAFECGEITEDQHFGTYYNDRREVDGDAIVNWMFKRYEWLPGMRELCKELQEAGIEMATCSNYPAPWAPLVEEATQLSQYVQWAFISGESGVRKPSAEAYAAALELVGREASDVVFVDDSATNCAAARAVGITAIHFQGAHALRAALSLEGFPLDLNDDVVRKACVELSAEPDTGENGEEGGGGGESSTNVNEAGDTQGLDAAEGQ